LKAYEFLGKEGLDMTEDVKVYKPSKSFVSSANLTLEKYNDMYNSSLENPEKFWGEHGKRLKWITEYTKVKNVSWNKEDLNIEWYSDGTLNVSENCIDRHLDERGDKVAIIWEADEPNQSIKLTYKQLYTQVCRFSNVLKNNGVLKGDRVTIYMPMIPEAAIAMLACARIGAIHSVVFAGFSPEALAGRIKDCGSNFVITADEGLRGTKKIPLKANCNVACDIAGIVKKVLTIRRTGKEIEMLAGRDVWLHDELKGAADSCAPEPMNSEDPLFILYTSGSTGAPKGVLHTSGGYLVWASMTHEYVFDIKENDVYWCSADVGWVTGHTYIIYGPLANGTTTVLYEGVPTYPNASRFWDICDEHNVSIFYTAPTAIRSLMREGAGPVEATSRKSLRLLGTVGEPINPEAWEWYYHTVGNSRCPIVDTWWQTETGGAMIVPLPGATDMKPGAGAHPFFGIVPALVDASGDELKGEADGNLIIKSSWPGQMRTVYGNHERFIDTYFSAYPNSYFTGDGCRRDKDGFYWITGRVDDVINVSGHRMGTAEIESALVSHNSISEAAVVGYPHDIKGQGIYAYVTVKANTEVSSFLKE
jgi:acetyl-CoA synthetase